MKYVRDHSFTMPVKKDAAATAPRVIILSRIRLSFLRTLLTDSSPHANRVQSCVFMVIGLALKGKVWYDLKSVRTHKKIKTPDLEYSFTVSSARSPIAIQDTHCWSV
jgi:hypothetical protein